MEGITPATRTVTLKPQSLEQMIARQVSDHKPGPVFEESIFARQLAETVSV